MLQAIADSRSTGSITGNNLVTSDDDSKNDSTGKSCSLLTVVIHVCHFQRARDPMAAGHRSSEPWQIWAGLDALTP